MESAFSDTVVGAILGSVIAIVGILINNIFQARAAKLERDHKLKSEIFMNAIDFFVQRRRALITMPYMTIEEMKALPDKSSAAARVSVVAENRTLQAVNELSLAMAEKTLALMPEKEPIDGLMKDLDENMEQRKEIDRKLKNALNEIEAVSLKEDEISVYRDRLDKYVENLRSEDVVLRDSHAEKYRSLAKLAGSLSIKCVDAAISFQDLEIKAVSYMRSELNMPFNEDEYRSAIESTNEKIKQHHRDFLYAIKQH
ncbi:hypothetical protein NBRC116587_39080 [Pseudoteredinibacter isoporae]